MRRFRDSSHTFGMTFDCHAGTIAKHLYPHYDTLVVRCHSDDSKEEEISAQAHVILRGNNPEESPARIVGDSSSGDCPRSE